MPDPATSTAPTESFAGMPFEELMEQLEALTETLESGEGSLAESLEAYERGVLLARVCMERLQRADLRIQELRLEG